MLVVQVSDKSSPKQPLGQRREFIPCRRLAVHPPRATANEPALAAARSAHGRRISPRSGIRDFLKKLIGNAESGHSDTTA
jgi:hypothetical protein